MIEIADEEIDLTKRNLRMKEQEKARIKGNNNCTYYPLYYLYKLYIKLFFR